MTPERVYVLVAIDKHANWDEDDFKDALATILFEDQFAVADVTDLLTYNKSTPGDPWDKPYPAMYGPLVERLS